MRQLISRTRLCETASRQATFPSWRPRRSIDHILVTPELKVASCQVIHHTCSDHLPVAMEVSLPDRVCLSA
jgi:endonuclease/exonuclease/phosphatase family metal-dependent hydrolase